MSPDPGGAPELSVVIPVRNGAETLPALLASLAAQAIDAGRFEVIVVDNASGDDTASIARSHGARVVTEPIPNRSRARNAGAAAASTDLLVFTDADCVASPGWLRALLSCRGKAPLVAGQVVIETHDPPNVIERFERASRFDQETWIAGGWAATANLLVERAAFDAVAGFDPGYRHIGEDADFCLRAGEAGLTLGYCADAVVRHYGERELPPVARRAFFHGYSAAQVLRQHGRGHLAWRHPRPLGSPQAALAWHGIDASSMTAGERRRQAALAWAAYLSRVLGALWYSLLHAGRGRRTPRT